MKISKYLCGSVRVKTQVQQVDILTRSGGSMVVGSPNLTIFIEAGEIQLFVWIGLRKT